MGSRGVQLLPPLVDSAGDCNPRRGSRWSLDLLSRHRGKSSHDDDAVSIEIRMIFHISPLQINWPPEDYDPEDDEIAKVYTNGGKVPSSLSLRSLAATMRNQ